MSDPFALLGLDAEADLAAVQSARRRLARVLHPDAGGDARAMAAVNEAARRCAEIIAARPPAGLQSAPRPRSAPGRAPVAWDLPALQIEALPAVAYEALLLAGAELGQIGEEDPPYLLEVLWDPPLQCWTRLEILPEAGSSMVGIRLTAADGVPPPPLEVVRDRLIGALNALDWDRL